MASASSHDYPDSPCRRDNWHGQPEIHTAVDEHRDGEIKWARATRRQEKARHVAHLLLRGVAPALCAVTCDDPARVPVELGDPEHYPTSEGNREHLRAVRANATDGYLTGGESTAVVLDGTPTEKFLALIKTWLDYCVAEGHIGTDLRDDLERDAASLKQGTDLRDERVLQILVRDVLAGERSTPGED